MVSYAGARGSSACWVTERCAEVGTMRSGWDWEAVKWVGSDVGEGREVRWDQILRSHYILDCFQKIICCCGTSYREKKQHQFRRFCSLRCQ